jgi:hypothetical protein
MNDFSLPAMGIFRLSSSSKDASGTEEYNFKCKTSYHIKLIRLRMRPADPSFREIYLESTDCSSLIKMMQASYVVINNGYIKFKDLNIPLIYTYSTSGMNAIKVAHILFETIILEK